MPKSSNDKWKTLIHNGPLFPPPYTPHGIPIKVKGKTLKLTPAQEEIATLYAREYLSTGVQHYNDSTFNSNFFNDFKQYFPKNTFTSFKDIDFGPIVEYLRNKKETDTQRKKEMDKAAKKAVEARKEELRNQYGYVTIDDEYVKLDGFRIEPPGIFKGRGAHARKGMIKRRINPEDVILNLGEKAAVPKPSSAVDDEAFYIKGKWRDIVHDHNKQWIAAWDDPLSNKRKYIWVGKESTIRKEGDKTKFDLARGLKYYIKHLRELVNHDLHSKELKTRQLAVATYLIDKLALRNGNEKDKDEADTVGCTTLRVEHVTLDKENVIHLDFLAKDSMRYQSSIEVSNDVYKNLESFIKGKKKEDALFDRINSTDINNYLKAVMPGLTAKVIRTYNASITLEQELRKIDFDKTNSVDVKVYMFNEANKQVAILCNHQRTKTKKHDEQIAKIETKIQELEAEKEEVKEMIVQIKRGKTIKKNNRTITLDAATKKLTRIENSLLKHKMTLDGKESMTTIALGTSKTNYIDPRIMIAWAKRAGVSESKILTKTLRTKFSWAEDTPEDYVW